jgi:hypothetical protein
VVARCSTGGAGAAKAVLRMAGPRTTIEWAVASSTRTATVTERSGREYRPAGV